MLSINVDHYTRLIMDKSKQAPSRIFVNFSLDPKDEFDEVNIKTALSTVYKLKSSWSSLMMMTMGILVLEHVGEIMAEMIY